MIRKGRTSNTAFVEINENMKGLPANRLGVYLPGKRLACPSTMAADMDSVTLVSAAGINWTLRYLRNKKAF